MVTRAGVTKLIDFGAALTLRMPPTTARFVGKFRYVAPERIEGRPEDRRGDVYSLGVILYEYLTGSRPFEGDDLAMVSRILEGRPRPPQDLAPHLLPELARITCKALALRADDRYPTAAQLATDLLPLLEGHDLLPGKDETQRCLRRAFDMPGTLGDDVDSPGTSETDTKTVEMEVTALKEALRRTRDDTTVVRRAAALQRRRPPTDTRGVQAARGTAATRATGIRPRQHSANTPTPQLETTQPETPQPETKVDAPRMAARPIVEAAPPAPAAPAPVAASVAPSAPVPAGLVSPIPSTVSAPPPSLASALRPITILTSPLLPASFAAQTSSPPTSAPAPAAPAPTAMVRTGASAPVSAALAAPPPSGPASVAPTWLFERRARPAPPTTAQGFFPERTPPPSAGWFDVHRADSAGPGPSISGPVPRPRPQESSAPAFVERRGERALEAPREERRRPPVDEAVRLFDHGLSLLADKLYAAALDEWERACALEPENRLYQVNLKRLRDRILSESLPSTRSVHEHEKRESQ
jgi:hypothetical protein